MDSLRYWLTEMHVDGFRFDLAPDPGPRGRRLRPARRRSSTSSPRIRSCRRPSSSPSRGTSARPTATTSAASRRCGASGTAATGTRVRDFWRRRDGLLGELATRFSGSSDLYGGSRPAADGVGQPRHRARRLHAARPGLLRRQAQRGQRRGQPRRHRRQPVVELRRRGADRRSRRARPARPAVARAADAPCCCRSACRCCSAATSSAAPSRATTTPTARTTRSTWFDWSARRRRPARLHPTPDRAAPRPPGVPAPALPRRRRGRRGLRWFTPAGDADDRRRTGPTPTPAASPSTSTARRPRPAPRTARRWSTTTSSCSSTAGGSR